jgi:YgiT-type zinc finger domain-containing protein
MKITITRCPQCGSQDIQRVQQDWTGHYHGQPYHVPAIELYECLACGEKVYDQDAMRKIEAASPAFQPTPKQSRGAQSLNRRLKKPPHRMAA